MLFSHAPHRPVMDEPQTKYKYTVIRSSTNIIAHEKTCSDTVMEKVFRQAILCIEDTDYTSDIWRNYSSPYAKGLLKLTKI